MSKTITIDWKGGSRRIELQDPGEARRLKQLTLIPSPLAMTPASLAWINSTLVVGSELSKDEVESMPISDGFGLLSSVMNYWTDLKDEANAESDSDKPAVPELEGIELDDQGAVDVEDMR